jgi:DNA-binding NarL/FixJ family response regulator
MRFHILKKRKSQKRQPAVPHVNFTLTKREQEIAALIAEELSYKMISARLKISVRTVETHARNIHNKTGKHNVAGVINHLHKSKKNKK